MAAASVGYVCRVAVTVVAPNMMREFGLTQTQMGTVVSAFLVGYTLFQVPSGGLADRVSARRIFLFLCGDGFLCLPLWSMTTASNSPTRMKKSTPLQPRRTLPNCWAFPGELRCFAFARFTHRREKPPSME